MLEKARTEIDDIDAEILKLLTKRLEICKRLGEYKKKNNLPVQNKERERQIIRERAQKLKELGFDDEDFVQELFGLIMKKSREVQK